MVREAMEMVDLIPRYAIVLTHNRPELLRQCIDAIEPQANLVLVIDNASDPPATYTGTSTKVKVLHVPDQPPNLAALWNRGLPGGWRAPRRRWGPGTWPSCVMTPHPPKAGTRPSPGA